MHPKYMTMGHQQMVKMLLDVSVSETDVASHEVYFHSSTTCSALF